MPTYIRGGRGSFPGAPRRSVAGPFVRAGVGAWQSEVAGRLCPCHKMEGFVTQCISRYS
jgi:hypothetical protein